MLVFSQGSQISAVSRWWKSFFTKLKGGKYITHKFIFTNCNIVTNNSVIYIISRIFITRFTTYKGGGELKRYSETVCQHIWHLHRPVMDLSLWGEKQTRQNNIADVELFYLEGRREKHVTPVNFALQASCHLMGLPYEWTPILYRCLVRISLAICVQ